MRTSSHWLAQKDVHSFSDTGRWPSNSANVAPSPHGGKTDMKYYTMKHDHIQKNVVCHLLSLSHGMVWWRTGEVALARLSNSSFSWTAEPGGRNVNTVRARKYSSYRGELFAYVRKKTCIATAVTNRRWRKLRTLV